MVYMDKPAIRQTTVVHAQWSDMPEEVVDAVRDMWSNREFGNDYYYVELGEEDFHDADSDDEYGYPVIAKYLRDNGITECLIHYWW